MIKTDNGVRENVVPMLLHTEQAATMMALSPRTLEDWRLTARGPRFVRLGRAVRYRPEDIIAFLNGQTFLNTGEANLAA